VVYVATPWIVLATFWAYTWKRPMRRVMAISSTVFTLAFVLLHVPQLAGFPDLSGVSPDAPLYFGLAVLFVLPVIALFWGVIAVSAAWPRRAK